MLILATRVSKSKNRLLSVGLLALVAGAGLLNNVLTINDLSEIGGKMTKTRSDLKLEEKWNVEALYAGPEDWGKDFNELKGKEGSKIKWGSIESFKGKLKDPKVAAGFFDLYFGLNRKLEKLYTYAHLRHDEDLGNDNFKRDYGLISSLIYDFQEQCSWVEPELLSLHEDDFKKLVFDQALTPYQFFLQKMGRMRPHTLSAEMELLMALSGKALDASSRAFGALNNADLKFKPAVDETGKEHPLSNGSYQSYMKSPDRTLRKSALMNLLEGFEEHANTLCELLNGQVQSHLYHAKARKFNSCLEAALFPHQIDPVVYTNLIQSIQKGLPTMHEYMAFRKKLLGVDELHYYDLMVPLVEKVEMSMSYKEACEAVIESVAPLGIDYQNEVRKGLIEERWVDVYETPRKRSGGYSSGCYDSMPYILLNYQGTLNDVLTLAHEVGHSMHSQLSRKTQDYVYAQYPIFVAEVASTFNEQLLLKTLKERAKTKKEKAYLINYEIEGIRATIFRQTLFAEFELQLHKWAEEGVPLTPDLLKKTYLDLNRKYYGNDLVIDTELAIEWARIPHFYYNFYVYQYATGLSAALTLYQQALKSGDQVGKYLTFLSSGGSKYPLDLLEQAGVDMRSTGAIDGAMERFALLLQELKGLFELDEKKN